MRQFVCYRWATLRMASNGRGIVGYLKMEQRNGLFARC